MRASSASRMSVSARSPALSVSCSLAASVSTCRHSCWRRFRLSCSCLALTCWCSCSLSSSTATARSTRSAAPGLASAISRSTSASRRSIAPAGQHLGQRLLGRDARCSSSPASVSSRAAATSASPRRRSRCSNCAARILEPPRQRRRVVRRNRRQAVPLHLQLGEPIHGVGAVQPFDRLADGDTFGLLALALDASFLFRRAFGRAHGRRFAHGFDRSLEPLRQGVIHVGVGLQLGPRDAHPAERRIGLGRIRHRNQRLGLRYQRGAALTILGAHGRGRRRRGAPSPRPPGDAGGRAPCASPPCCARAVRRRPRRSGSSRRSSAATAVSVCSDLSATALSSSGSDRRASARRRVWPSVACRLTDPRARASLSPSTTTAFTPGCALSRATTVSFLEAPGFGQLPHDVAGHVLVRRLGGHADQLTQRLRAHVRVGIGPEQVAEHRDVVRSATTAARRTRASASSRAIDTSTSASSAPSS